MKKEKIWVHRYELESIAALNSRSPGKVRVGALIRCGSGFGCIHPWPELGDDPLETQLSLLAGGTMTPITERTLECSRADGAARENAVSLFSGKTAIPPSHWFYLSGDQPGKILGAGFDRVKLKIGPNRSALTRQTETMREMVAEGLLLRLDANESIEVDLFRHWWSSLDSTIRDGIEFVEDPVPWRDEAIEELALMGVPIGADRQVARMPTHCGHVILKPAVDRMEPLLEWVRERGLEVVVTSYMDHPLGQVWAAYRAVEVHLFDPDRLGQCGLLTNRCYRNRDSFFERIKSHGPNLLSPGGTGLGFDEELERLPWKRLN